MAGIGVIVSFIVSLLAIASAFAGVIASFTKLKTNHENLETRVNKQDESIKELYDSRNKTNESLVQLTTILTNLVEQNKSLVDQNKAIERKIDDLREKISK